ncbi:DUF7824 domain-containing protein [Streptomyces virginiae]|uniref:DUF7824 domain-containing protein n=1 Tax=Streptomyces virginiae TaxID=1961 RepID=UPI00345D0D37
MNTLLDAVRTGRCTLVTHLITRLTDAERRAHLPELTALRAEIRTWDWSRRWDAEPTLRALHLAGAGCHTGPAAAASWIAARDLRDARPRDTAPLAALLAGRAPAWRADVAHRLAARTATVDDDYPLIRALLDGTEAPAPTTDGFVHAWARATTTATTPPPPGRHRPRPRPRPLRVALREDPHTPHLVPHLFETAEPAPSLTWYDTPHTPGRWPAELAHLATEGTVERRTLIDGSINRLLRGGRTAHLAFYTDLLDVLDLTTDERAEHTADWIALAADAPSPTAGRAQQTLTALFEAGRLPADRLAEMSQAVLFRPEKKLVRAQLVLLGKALRRSGEDRSTLLPATAAAFGHPDTLLQEKALKLVAAHLRPGDDALRTDLAFEAEHLGPALRRTAAALLGAIADPTDPAGYEETLPAAPARRPLTTAGRSLAETAELVAALANTNAATTEETETALDLLVRHAHQDRTALAAALLPALADRHWARQDTGHADPDHLSGPELLAAAVLDRLDPADLAPQRPINGRGFGQHCIHDALQRVTTARAREAALRVLTDPLPFLLATPTWDCGTLEPQDLITRLTAYARQGCVPAPADFAQALLRVRRDPHAAAQAEALATDEGRRLAAWLTADGAPAPHTRHVTDRGPRTWWGGQQDMPRRIVLELPEHQFIQKEFPAVFHPLGRPRTATGHCWHWRGQELAHLAVLPQDRETQAVWLLPDLTGCAIGEDRGAGEVLSRLAELGGPAGPALHLAVATALGARHTEDRLAAVDALLVLAATGELDTALLGRDLAELLRLGTVKPNRLADAARTAAATGAYATTWAVLAGALPAVLDDGPARGAGELLAVAADCVEHCGAGGPLPEGLAPAAARKGTSQLATQARRLRTALDNPPATAERGRLTLTLGERGA